MLPHRLVLSRKGFDSGYGGMPSPILPDGRLLPLPIPSRHDAFRLGDLNADGVALGPVLRDLSCGRHSRRTRVHLDPDLDRRADLRPPGWRPALGQAGSAQSHLRDQGVGAEDVFLFFGWFRQVERHAGRWRYVPGAPHLHLIYGWLEVEEVLAVVTDRERCLRRHPWIASHPHVANPDHYSDPRNTLYVAPRRSKLGLDGPGGGVFTRYADGLRLTAEGASRSVWTLPDWFHPGEGRSALTYHANPDRWRRIGEHCELRSVAKGQEFVLDTAGRVDARAWLRALMAPHRDLRQAGPA
ncbi:MAG: hypothetical protein ACTHXB_10310 [Luteimonas sp.]